MGNCIYSQHISNNLTDQFVDYNIIDKQYNIIIGIYKNSNTSIEQGICVGYINNQINKLKFAMIHRHDDIIVELFFDNNIKCLLVKNNIDNKVKLTLSSENILIEKYIDVDIIKKIKLIDNNSEYIDLIHKII